jgi:hypothetical protein
MTLVSGEGLVAVPPTERDLGAVSPPERGGGAARWWTLAALVPFAAMAYTAATGSRLNYQDYWQVLALVTNPNGSLRLHGLATLYCGHPIELAGTLFWLDATLFGGDNRALALLCVVLGAVVVVALNRMLPAGLTGLRRSALTVVFSVLVFSPAALEMFAIGMSGTFWLVGLAPSVVAIVLAHRGRMIPAVLVAGLASLGHGSALPVWIALCVVAWLRADPVWRLVLPAVLGVGVISTWLVLPKVSCDVVSPAPVGMDTMVASVTGTLSPLRDTTTASVSIAVGALVAGAAVVLIGGAVRARVLAGSSSSSTGGAAVGLRDEAGWVGLCVQLLLVAVLVSGTRVGFGLAGGLASRYSLVSGLVTSAVLALIVLRNPRVSAGRIGAAAVCLSLIVYAAGASPATNVRNQLGPQRLLAIAMRVGETGVPSGESISPASMPAARRLGVYPFNASYDLGCAGLELGGHVDLGTVGTLPLGDIGIPTRGMIDGPPSGADLKFTGWAVIADHHPDCVVVVDHSGTVVGGGVTGLPRPDVATAIGTSDQYTGWEAVAAPGTAGDRVLVSLRGKLSRVPAAPTG